jgi:hypothetical protein
MVVMIELGTLGTDELTSMGMAELLTGVEVAPTGGMTAPGVEQMVVVVATTVVEVSKTVEPAGQSGAFVHSEVWTKVAVTRMTSVVVSAIARRLPVQMLEELEQACGGVSEAMIPPSSAVGWSEEPWEKRELTIASDQWVGCRHSTSEESGKLEQLHGRV